MSSVFGESGRGVFDVVIIGGGLVGASLAVALGNTNKKVALIEPHTIHSEEHSSFDERTIALTYNAKLIFSGMGVWHAITTKKAEPIYDIHISNKGHMGITHLSHKDIGTDAMGYVVPSRVIGEVLWDKIHTFKNITLFNPAAAENIKQQDENCTITISGQKPESISGKLVAVSYTHLTLPTTSRV